MRASGGLGAPAEPEIEGFQYEILVPSADFTYTNQTGPWQDYTIDWGDNSSDVATNGSLSHVYAEPGLYVIKITDVIGTYTAAWNTSSDAGRVTRILGAEAGFPWHSSFSRAFRMPDGAIANEMGMIYPNGSGAGNFQNCWERWQFTFFPAIDLSEGTYFPRAWQSCTNLVDFPLLTWNSGITNMANCWNGCALSAQSIENILVGLDDSGATGISTSLGSGTNADTSTWTPAANTAYLSLVGKGWTINVNGTPPS